MSPTIIRSHTSLTLRLVVYRTKKSMVVGRVIETRTVARTPGVQAQFVTLTVPTKYF